MAPGRHGRPSKVPPMQKLQCLPLLHGCPALAPPTQVFTHSEPGPNPTQFPPTVQDTLLHGTFDGHGHGPENE